MLRNYFKTAFRNLTKNRSGGLINLTGLSIGMAAAILILLWVQNEVNFDNYHPNHNRIYYVKMGHNADPVKFGGTPLLLAETVQQQVPEIEKTARLFIVNNNTSPVLDINNNFYREPNLAYVDKEWFDIFHYDFIAGNAQGFSQNPNSIILTAPLARKYFGYSNPLDHVVVIDSIPYHIQGIVKDNPSNSSFQFGIFLPMEVCLRNSFISNKSWLSYSFQTFIETKENSNPTRVKQQIDNILLHQDQIRAMSLNGGKKDTISASLTALASLHFDNPNGIAAFRQGDKKVVFIFSVLGLLLLAIACINYVNLATAKASQRSREVSIKKIMGAARSNLFIQFMVESALTGLISLTLTIIIVRISLPWFNRFTENHFVFSITSFAAWKVLAGTLLFTVLLTGIYPALLLSSFNPLNVLRGFTILRIKNTSLRKVLVTTQFVIAIGLTISTVVILKQLNYIQNDNEGYRRNQIFSIALPSSWSKDHKNIDKTAFTNLIINELSQQTAIQNVAVSNDAVFNLKMSISGIADWRNKRPDDAPSISPLTADAGFRKIFNLQLKEGRWFEPGNANDKHNYILNETAVAEMGLEQPYLGQYFSLFGDTGIIIGIAKDFHFRDYHQKITAAVLFNNPSIKGTFFIQTAPSKMKQALAGAETTWKKFFPQTPFEYNFLDQQFEQMYKSDIRASTLVGLFSGIAIFISCLGLFGLVAFAAEQRTKEIGIRKILGASVFSITILLSKEFVKLISIAILIASPVAWWAMNKWLNAFAYKINIGWWMFAAAGLMALTVALLTVSFKSVKAALANPVRNLRME